MKMPEEELASVSAKCRLGSHQHTVDGKNHESEWHYPSSGRAEA